MRRIPIRDSGQRQQDDRFAELQGPDPRYPSAALALAMSVLFWPLLAGVGLSIYWMLF